MGKTSITPSAIPWKRWRLFCIRASVLLLIVLICITASSAYSVLTHEEIVDLLWSDEIQPLILKRFPGLSADQLKEAHAYAYGGAVIQDLGYYPFGNREFSDLVHYVRSGDFVRELLTVKQLIEALKKFPLDAKVFYEMGPNGAGTIGKAQYVKVRGEGDQLGVLLDR